ncbi:type I-E CRISPR-associated protein Cas5/CasD [Rhizobium sp. RU36D]|uniref:type I-E CRISPR-associated protein Cas5/CasD n=1 Tax=Rhizobium sp. RU36D TaxID=1907415 RepID=UPI0009D856AD|nr:type I-E CRISPR-associated protein Cas5/CasD [Rhizobium sp. RU36D]SMD12709.1 CRISPR-associated protein, Cas5e family [Rhizobium sp. RU36D]
MPTTEKRWLILNLEAPLLAFGGVVIDQIGTTRDFPAASMLTGLFANALGWTRTETEKHQKLQDRLVFAARMDREMPAGILTDMQNVQLEKNDKGWTTWGTVEGRDGASYGAPHRRKRDYHMDARIVISMRLEPFEEEPDLVMLAEAIYRPARPLFIGRKPCLPSSPILAARRDDWFVDAPTAYAALSRQPAADERSRSGRLRAFWPPGEGPEDGQAVTRIYDLADLRNWRSGLHGGHRRVIEGFVVLEGGS